MASSMATAEIQRVQTDILSSEMFLLPRQAYGVEVSFSSSNDVQFVHN